MQVKKAPRLMVEGRGRPSRRFENTIQIGLRNGRSVESARGPALKEQGIDWMGGGASGIRHGISYVSIPQIVAEAMAKYRILVRQLLDQFIKAS
jgi:hypothetical protein